MNYIQIDPLGKDDFALLSEWIESGALGPLQVPLRADWLEVTHDDPNIIQAVIRPGEGDRPVGFIRIDMGPSGGEITLFVVQAHRRLGLGKKMVEWAIKHNGSATIYALVEKDNQKGRAFFSALGFLEEKITAIGKSRWTRPAKGKI